MNYVYFTQFLPIPKDPFCGTGSLLLAAASLGATVVGSDIDGECLGYPNPPRTTSSPGPGPSLGAVDVSNDDTTLTTTASLSPSPSPVALVKKNNAFQRFGVFNYSQENKTTVSISTPCSCHVMSCHVPSQIVIPMYFSLSQIHKRTHLIISHSVFPGG